MREREGSRCLFVARSVRKQKALPATPAPNTVSWAPRKVYRVATARASLARKICLSLILTPLRMNTPAPDGWCGSIARVKQGLSGAMLRKPRCRKSLHSDTETSAYEKSAGPSEREIHGMANPNAFAAYVNSTVISPRYPTT